MPPLNQIMGEKSTGQKTKKLTRCSQERRSRKKGGDPHIGRKLRKLFITAGLETTIGIGNNRIWSCEEDKQYYLHSRDFYIKILKDAGLTEKEIDQWEYEFLKSLDEGVQLNFFPQFYAIGTKPKS